MSQPRKKPSYAEPADWRWLVDDLRAHELDARVHVGFLDALSVEVDLGDGWACSITTTKSDLRTYHWRDDPLVVYVGGPTVPHEGYRLDWFPPPERLGRLPAAIVPLLKRIAAAGGVEESVPAVEVLTLDNADQALRAMLGAATDFPSVWDVFCRFAAVAIDELDPAEDEDLLLFECVAETAAPTISLVRQFAVVGDEPDADPDERELAQLSCELRFAPNPELVDAFRQVEPLWGAAGANVRQWADQVERSAAFAAASAGSVVAVEVDQSLV